MTAGLPAWNTTRRWCGFAHHQRIKGAPAVGVHGSDASLVSPGIPPAIAAWCSPLQTRRCLTDQSSPQFRNPQASTDMSMTSLLTFTPWPAVSAAILLILLVAALYFARDTAHQAIQAAADVLARGLRIASHSVIHAQGRLAARNRESC